MPRLSVAQARENFDAAISAVAAGERVILSKRGKGVAAMVSIEDLHEMEELEDRIDAQVLAKARRQWEKNGRKGIPWEQVKKELGL